jgi:hypothetical protein
LHASYQTARIVNCEPETAKEYATRWICAGCIHFAVLSYRRLILFAFFSNRLGCAGSLLVSLIGTIILILLFNVVL